MAFRHNSSLIFYGVDHICNRMRQFKESTLGEVLNVNVKLNWPKSANIHHP